MELRFITGESSILGLKHSGKPVIITQCFFQFAKYTCSCFNGVFTFWVKNLPSAAQYFLRNRTKTGQPVHVLTEGPVPCLTPVSAQQGGTMRLFRIHSQIQLGVTL